MMWWITSAVLAFESREVTISYLAPTPVKEVRMEMLGQTPHLLMETDASRRWWRSKISLEPGVYIYYFVVDGKPTIDATKPVGEAICFYDHSQPTNQLVVEPKSYAKHVSAIDDGIITTEAVKHQPKLDASPSGNGVYNLRLRVRRGDVARCTIVVFTNVGQKSIPMVQSGSDPLFDTFRARVALGGATQLRYEFVVVDGDMKLRLTADGIKTGFARGEPFVLSGA